MYLIRRETRTSFSGKEVVLPFPASLEKLRSGYPALRKEIIIFSSRAILLRACGLYVLYIVIIPFRVSGRSK